MYIREGQIVHGQSLEGVDFATKLRGRISLHSLTFAVHFFLKSSFFGHESLADPRARNSLVQVPVFRTHSQERSSCVNPTISDAIICNYRCAISASRGNRRFWYSFVCTSESFLVEERGGARYIFTAQIPVDKR